MPADTATTTTDAAARIPLPTTPSGTSISVSRTSIREALQHAGRIASWSSATTIFCENNNKKKKKKKKKNDDEFMAQNISSTTTTTTTSRTVHSSFHAIREKKQGRRGYGYNDEDEDEDDDEKENKDLPTPPGPDGGGYKKRCYGYGYNDENDEDDEDEDTPDNEDDEKLSNATGRLSMKSEFSRPPPSPPAKKGFKELININRNITKNATMASSNNLAWVPNGSQEQEQ
ncbi:hypothetical protein BGZ65_009116 [Modicella reniformis]|uniref:Uncharacterized protein n=1 Tax=Modicella reniformis TaxID=1440133 RepID=A0A9P6MER3_9FUNG|nr:hypothetical protein BGZ65_009116 [Modicella reniformis]